jgi:hypothetical protein
MLIFPVHFIKLAPYSLYSSAKVFLLKFPRNRRRGAADVGIVVLMARGWDCQK